MIHVIEIWRGKMNIEVRKWQDYLFLTDFKSDFIGGDGGVSSDGVGGRDGRCVDLGIGIVGRRGRVQPASAIVDLQPIQHRCAVD